jgi:hypothetical protein
VKDLQQNVCIGNLTVQIIRDLSLAKEETRSRAPLATDFGNVAF